MKRMMTWLAITIGAAGAWMFYQRRRNPADQMNRETRKELKDIQRTIMENLNIFADKIVQLQNEWGKKGGKMMGDNIRHMERMKKTLQGKIENLKSSMHGPKAA